MPSTASTSDTTATRHGIAKSYDPVMSDPANSGPGDATRLRAQYPELDWDDPDGAAETLAILGDPDAMAELEEAEHDIATGNVVPLDRYAPPH